MRRLLARLFRRPAYVPPYPQRCQHCNADLRLRRHPTSAVFEDRTGQIVCDPHRTPWLIHKPMPSILG